MLPRAMYPAMLALFLGACVIGSVEQKSAPAASNATRNEEESISTILKSVKGAFAKSDYQIHPTDLLEFTVYREDDLSRTVRVSQQGTISLPLIGEIPVAGFSVSEAQNRVAQRLSDFLVRPQVTIFIKEYGNKQIYVLGEVSKPGAYELPTESRLTVVEAISLAGGFTAVAAKDRTRIIRTLGDGSNHSTTIEVSAITQRGEKDKDLSLEPNDVIYVPQSLF